MRTRDGIRRHALVIAACAVATVVAHDALADTRLARTCITTLQTDDGPVKVLRKIGPQQSCKPGESLFTWDRVGFTVLSGGTVERITSSDGARYSGPGVGGVSADINAVRIPVRGGTLHNLRVQTEVLSGSSVEVRVVVGLNETSVACTATGNFCTNVTDSFDAHDGDTVAVKIVATGPVVPTYVSYSLEFAPPPLP